MHNVPDISDNPDIPTIFKIGVKNEKNDFFIFYISYSNDFKSCIPFSDLLQCVEVTCRKSESNGASSNIQHCFCAFCIYLTKNN